MHDVLIIGDRMFYSFPGVFLVLLIMMPPAFAADILGAGATFPAPVYQDWASVYVRNKNVRINYVGVGSGEGIKRIEARAVDFGASDMALTIDELNKQGLLQFPMLVGAISPVVNLPDLPMGDLKLDGPALAAIYLGKIRKWDDAQLRKLNPRLTLPNLPISVVFREEASGTTFNFTNYLSKVSPEWKSAMGEGLTVKWTVGLGATGNAGVAAKIRETPGAIGYVEYADQKLNYVQMKNAVGNFISPNSSTVQSAAENVEWDAANGFYQVMTNAPGARSWPIAATTYILLAKEPGDAVQARETLAFFDWAYRRGELQAIAKDYVMLPLPLITKVRASWLAIKGKDGAPVWN